MATHTVVRVPCAVVVDQGWDPAVAAVVAFVPPSRWAGRQLVRLVVDHADRPAESRQGALGVLPRSPSPGTQGETQAGCRCDECACDEEEAGPSLDDDHDGRGGRKGTSPQGRLKQDPVLVVRSMQTQESKVSDTLVSPG